MDRLTAYSSRRSQQDRSCECTHSFLVKGPGNTSSLAVTTLKAAREEGILSTKKEQYYESLHNVLGCYKSLRDSGGQDHVNIDKTTLINLLSKYTM